jgi:hypothetical protein
MRQSFFYLYKKNKTLFVIFLISIIIIFSFINQSIDSE